MSTIAPVVPPIAPSEAEKVNAPEPDSERAAKIEAEKARRVAEGELLPGATMDGTVARSVDREREAALARDAET